MHIHHVAIWAQDLEALKAFYCTLFGGQANERYHNPTKPAFFKIVVAQSCFKQPLSAPARVSRAAPDLASRHR